MAIQKLVNLHMDYPKEVRELVNALDGIVYVVDLNGVIRLVGERSWTAFALANGGDDIADPREIIGANLLSFVSGEQVRECYEQHFADLRDYENAPRSSFPFRCDAPDARREMRMAISPVVFDGRHRGFLFQSILWHEAPRPPMGLFDFTNLTELKEALGVDSSIIVMCSFCQKVRWPSDNAEHEKEWIDAEEYYSRGGNEQVGISHGMCPPCKATQDACWKSRQQISEGSGRHQD